MTFLDMMGLTLPCREGKAGTGAGWVTDTHFVTIPGRQTMKESMEPLGPRGASFVLQQSV